MEVKIHFFRPVDSKKCSQLPRKASIPLKNMGMCSGGVNYPRGNVVCHETSYFWTCVVELRKMSFVFAIFAAFSEGILQKRLPDKISGAIFEVFFAILARRVGCTTKPF